MSIASNFPAISPALSLDFAAVKALDPRITFTRASTATYYGTQTAKAEENLLTYSQDLDNAAWTKSRVSATANSIAAPDGTTTAELIVENSETNTHYILRNGGFSANTTYVLSIFAKAKERSIITLGGFSNATTGAYFDLTAPSATLFAASVGVTPSDAVITDAGDGWYRCSVVLSIGSTTPLYFACVLQSTTPAALTTGYAGDGTSGLYLWGAQLEQRDAVTAYTVTTTQAITNYIPVLETSASGVARFDHNPTTFESLGLLIEEQRTNLLTYSETFDNAAWTKANATITANTVVAPDGTLTGDKLINNAAESNGYATQGASLTSGTVYTFSCYAKTAGATNVRIRATGSGTWASAVVDLTTGVVSGTLLTGTATVTSVGNGYYRITVTGTCDLTGTNTFWVYDYNTGDGYSGIYIWGASLEQGAFSTSYIKTEASQVTRAADAASMTGANFSSWFNQGQGTLYGEAGANRSFDLGRAIFEVGDGTLINRIFLGTAGASTNAALSAISNNVLQVSSSFVGAFSSGSAKLSLAYKQNDFAASANGVTALTDTSGLIPVVNQTTFGRTTSNQVYWNGTIKKLSYYPIRCTNAQLQGLTS